MVTVPNEWVRTLHTLVMAFRKRKGAVKANPAVVLSLAPKRIRKGLMSLWEL
jgi:hypothetical protein